MQRGVLRGERVVGHEGVDPVRVGGQRGSQVWWRHGPGALGGAAQPDGACLHVAWQRGLAKQFGQRAAGLATADIHLEQPVAGLYPALEEEQVMQGRRLDMGDPVVVLHEPRSRLQARHPGGCQ